MGNRPVPSVTNGEEINNMVMASSTVTNKKMATTRTREIVPPTFLFWSVRCITQSYRGQVFDKLQLSKPSNRGRHSYAY